MLSYYKSSDLNYVPQNISNSSYYCLAGDVSGTLFFLEELYPGFEYVYNIIQWK